MFENFLVVRQPQRAEDDHDGHVALDVGEAGTQDGPDAAAAAARAALGQHPHGAGRERARRALGRRAALGGEGVFRGGLAEDVDVVVRHALLGDEHLLGAVDDEVAWAREGGGGRDKVARRGGSSGE